MPMTKQRDISGSTASFVSQTQLVYFLNGTSISTYIIRGCRRAANKYGMLWSTVTKCKGWTQKPLVFFKTKHLLDIVVVNTFSSAALLSVYWKQNEILCMSSSQKALTHSSRCKYTEACRGTGRTEAQTE